MCKKHGVCIFVLICRQDSFSNSEISLEQKSSDDTIKDTDPSLSSFPHSSSSPSLFPYGRPNSSPFSTPCSSMTLPSSSSSPLHHCAANVFQFDKPYSSALFETTGDKLTPPPLPPKPNHLSEHASDERLQRTRAMSARHFSSNAVFFPRRTSLSSLDHFKSSNFLGDAENRLAQNRRQSINLVRGSQTVVTLPFLHPFF